MRRYSLRLSSLSLSTLTIVLLYLSTPSTAYYGNDGGGSSYGTMGDVDWGKRSPMGAALNAGDDLDDEGAKVKRSLYSRWLSGSRNPGMSSYATMGDVDWGKRSPMGAALNARDDLDDEGAKVKRSLYSSWLSGSRNPVSAYGYRGGMGDADWGWRKRGDLSEEDDHEIPSSLYENYLRKRYRGGYKHRNRNTRYLYNDYRRRPYSSLPYTQPSTSRRSYSIRQPKQSKFHSMADMDWGWGRKKRTGGFNGNDYISDEDLNNLRALVELLSQEGEDNDEGVEVDKKNIGSIVRQADGKRNVASLARTNNYFDNDTYEKRNVAALARNSRNVGSLARNSRNVGSLMDDKGPNPAPLADDNAEFPSNDVTEKDSTDTNFLHEEKRHLASVARGFFGTGGARGSRHGVNRRGGMSSLARNGYLRNKIMYVRNPNHEY